MKVLIVDDDEKELALYSKRIKANFNKYIEDCFVNTTTDVKSIMKSGNALGYDIYFLDIDMPDVSGIEIAEQITRCNHNANIIFLTNRDDLVFTAIKYSPFRFIRKTKIKEELDEAVEAIIKKCNEESMLFDFSNKYGSICVYVREIMYIEIVRHYIHIHTFNKTHVFRGNMKDFEDRLDALGFIRVHVGYLVNVRSISRFNSKGAYLDNGELLPISRGKYEELKSKYIAYMRKFVYGEN